MQRGSRTSLLVLLATLSVLFAGCESSLAPQPQPLLTTHVRDVTVNGQAKAIGVLPADQTMRVDVVLPLRNEADLQRFIQEVNDPTHPSYHRFLEPADFTAKYGPSQQDWNALVAFAEAHGFQVTGGSRGARDLHLQGTVATIQEAFDLTLRVYQHPTENRTFYAPDREPTVALPFQLLHISGLDNYSIPHPMFHERAQSDPKPLATTGSGPSASYLGSDMRAAYYGNGSLAGTGQNIALLEYYGADLADLSTYYTNAHQTEPLIPTLISTDGTSTSCVTPGCDDTEQTLDMTQALGMAPGISGLYVYVGSTDTAIISAMTTTTDAPLSKQIGCSWGWTPADPSSLNGYWQTMAAQGQNFFVASGDNSTWTKTGKSAAWPGDAAYVVSVGGTSLTTTGAGGAWSAETAWTNSGGGTSPDSISIPSWQTSAAAACKSAGLGCSTTLRNGPDVSANADYTFYVCAKQTTCTANSYGGTSFAAPMWAGYLALANQQAATNGDTIGFLNPLLYPAAEGSSYASLFHDVTSGTSGSHHAGTGYDLVTGWGSPNGSSLITLLAPPPPSFTLSASPGTVSIAQGGAAGSSAISVTDVGGFSGSVTLSASGLPSGVTASFGTNPTTGTSVLSLSANSTVATGTSNVTITGTSGSLSATTTISLTIDGPYVCGSVAYDPDSPASPSSAGTTVTLSATATCTTGATAEYEFWLMPEGGSWSTLCPWQTSSTCQWSTPAAGNYEIQVWAKSSTSTGAYDSYAPVEYHLIGSPGTCSSVSLNADSPPSPSPNGQTVTLSASASCTGAGSAEYEFWLMPQGGSWSVLCPWQPSSSCQWTSPSDGSYEIQVWAKSSNSTASYDSYTPVENHVVGAAGSCTSVSMNPDSPASPSGSGQSVTLSASASCSGGGSAQYEFWLMPEGGSWSLLCPWQSGSTCQWTTPADGGYEIQVWAKSSNSTASYDSYTPVENHVVGAAGSCTSVSMNPDSPASPSGSGQSVTLSASASCSGGGSAQYEFWLMPEGGSWSVLCPWQSGSTCQWTTPADGGYEIQVWAKSTNSNAAYDSYTAVESHVVGTPGSCSSVSLNPDSPASPSSVGQTVTLSATATCSGGGTAEYEFWLTPSTGPWAMLCPWQSSSTCQWTNPTADTYTIQVWAKSSSSSATYDSYTPTETHVVQ